MDIQKQKNLYLAKLLEQEVIKQDEFEDLVFKPEINAFHSNYLSSRFMDNINFGWSAWQAATAQAVPEGFVLIKDDTKTVVAIERMVEQQVEASGIDSRRLERLDGWKIIEAAVKAQEPQITELKVEWASDCFKCGHHEAIIYSTAAEASTKGWFHDGDEVKCTGCGNTGEMDARGEDSDICWNEDEAND